MVGAVLALLDDGRLVEQQPQQRQRPQLGVGERVEQWHEQVLRLLAPLLAQLAEGERHVGQQRRHRVQQPLGAQRRRARSQRSSSGRSLSASALAPRKRLGGSEVDGSLSTRSTPSSSRPSASAASRESTICPPRPRRRRSSSIVVSKVRSSGQRSAASSEGSAASSCRTIGSARSSRPASLAV